MTDSEKQMEAKYPSKDYNKATYSFTQEERNKLMSLDSISQIGQMAQSILNGIIQGQCAARVGAQSGPGVGILYNIPAGQFFVYSPKVEEKKPEAKIGEAKIGEAKIGEAKIEVKEFKK